MTSLEVVPLQGLPLIRAGDDLVELVASALKRNGVMPRAGDVLVVAQKIVSKAEGRIVDLATIEPSAQAIALAADVDKDPRLVEVILSESVRVVRARRGVLIVEHRLGFIMANAGVDQSNVAPMDGSQRVLLLPENPDWSAKMLRRGLAALTGVDVAVVINDSFGRPWRQGTASVAIGAAGLPALVDLRGRLDLFGRRLEVSVVGFADEVAAAASLLMGQADEALPAVLIRGLRWVAPEFDSSQHHSSPKRGSVSMSWDLVVALSGGIGGAKLALGLSRIVAADNLLVVANVGDDFEHLGLHISPDTDTLMYTLAGLDNTKLGWGRQDETWSFMETLTALGGEDWFRLGDRDLAVHVERTRRLRRGETLSAITADFCRRLGVGPRVLPATDDPLRTRLRTDEGWLDFQDYFVRLQCRPVVREFAFKGADEARPHPDLLAALRDERLRAVIICPSNPFISVEPILAVPGMRRALSACAAPVIAVSPIIGRRAVKGPTAKMMGELGMAPSAAAVAERYGDLLDGYVMDIGDAEEAAEVAPRVTLAPTLMTNLAEREELARVVLEAASALASLKRGRDFVA